MKLKFDEAMGKKIAEYESELAKLREATGSDIAKLRAEFELQK